MRVYIKFFTYLFLKSFFYVLGIMFSLVFILNLLTELDFFKNIEVYSYFPLFLSFVRVVPPSCTHYNIVLSLISIK